MSEEPARDATFPAIGIEWTEARGVEVARFPADWEKTVARQGRFTISKCSTKGSPAW